MILSKYLDELLSLVDAGKYEAAIGYSRKLLGTPMQLSVIGENNRIELYFVTALLEEYVSGIGKKTELIKEAERICRKLLRARCVVETDVISAIRVLEPRIVWLRGEAFRNNDAMREAVEKAVIVARDLPENAEAWHTLGWVLERDRQPQAAAKALDKAWNLVGGVDKPLLTGRLLLCAARISLQENKPESVKKCCEAAFGYFNLVKPKAKVAAEMRQIRELMDDISGM